MSITYNKTCKRTTLDAPWYQQSTDKVSLVAEWVTAGKMIATASRPDPLTKIINRVYSSQAAYDEWFALPANQLDLTLQAVHETANGITWTRVITDTDTNTTTTDRSSDYSLTLTKS